MQSWEESIRGIYRDLRDPAPLGDSSIASEIQQALAIYAQDHEVRAESIIADDTHAIVLTAESRDGDAEPKAWRAAHVWTYSQTKVTSMDVYVLALTVAIPG